MAGAGGEMLRQRDEVAREGSAFTEVGETGLVIFLGAAVSCIFSRTSLHLIYSEKTIVGEASYLYFYTRAK